MDRKFPKFFAHHYLTELFYSNPAELIADLFLEKRLTEAWQQGAEEMREYAIKEQTPKSKPLFWKNYRVVLIELGPAKQTGEPQAVLWCWREATRSALMFLLEKAASGWCLTAVDSKRNHRYVAELDSNARETFVSKARESLDD